MTLPKRVRKEDPEANTPKDLAEEISQAEIASAPTDVGDPASIIEAKIPDDIRARYEIYSYRNAATILSETRKAEFENLLRALRDFRITKKMIRMPGKNESDIPKLLSKTLRPMGWHETVIQGDLVVKLTWRGPVGQYTRGKKKGEPKLGNLNRQITRTNYLDGHKIDYVKDRVAFDLEWNSKDQTFDRDLYAFSAFFQCGAIDAGVLVTRSKSLNPIFKILGDALKKDGATTDYGKPVSKKYGASTTWMGKLLYRLNAGRNGGCPILVVGITPKCIEDLTDEDLAAAAKQSDEPDSDA